ncbi:MAG: hypothetical protein AVO39_10890 [delta proteobacterium MLS_D]|nr:MAG: hypothetical protein AVO39_10890 [delta proteobacterium MLS_D]
MTEKNDRKELEATIEFLENSGLRGSDLPYRFLVDMMPDTVWVLDLDMTPRFVSPSSLKTLGYSPEERLRQHLSDMVTPETYARVIYVLQEELKKEQNREVDPDRIITIDMEYYHKDGHTVWLENRIRSIHDRDGRIIGLFGVSRDITDRRRLEGMLRERIKELSLFRSVANFIESTDSLEEVFQKTVDEIPRAWRYPDCACARITLNGYVFQTANFRETDWSIHADITVHGDRLGTLEVCYLSEMPDEEGNPFLDEERDLLKAIAKFLGRVVQRKQDEDRLKESERKYRELSILDDLSGLYNSRYFYKQLEEEIDRVNRYGGPLSLILLDIDNFKSFNDTFGHVEGDEVLSRLGEVIRRCMRKTDSAYRYGGEEFTVLLPVTRCGEGRVIAERIRTTFKNETFLPVPGESVHLTVSLGIAEYRPSENMKKFVHRADQLMYQAKEGGKDRICGEFPPAGRSC